MLMAMINLQARIITGWTQAFWFQWAACRPHRPAFPGNSPGRHGLRHNTCQHHKNHCQLIL